MPGLWGWEQVAGRKDLPESSQAAQCPEAYGDPSSRPEPLTAKVGAIFFEATPAQALIQDSVHQALYILQKDEGFRVEMVTLARGQCLPTPCRPLPSAVSSIHLPSPLGSLTCCPSLPFFFWVSAPRLRPSPSCSQESLKMLPALGLLFLQCLLDQAPTLEILCRLGLTFPGLGGWGPTPAPAFLLSAAGTPSSGASCQPGTPSSALLTLNLLLVTLILFLVSGRLGRGSFLGGRLSLWAQSSLST